MKTAREPAPYMNPYLAGVGLGLVLLLAFVLMGRGLGASGAFSTIVAVTQAATTSTGVTSRTASGAPSRASWCSKSSAS